MKPKIFLVMALDITVNIPRGFFFGWQFPDLSGFAFFLRFLPLAFSIRLPTTITRPGIGRNLADKRARSGNPFYS